jgi:hypothetical protein
MKRRVLAAAFVVVLGVALAPAAAQERQAPATVWRYTGMDRFTPKCPPGSGASLQVSGNSLTYTYRSAAEPNNPWVMLFTWEKPVLDGKSITARVEGKVRVEGPPSPTPSVRMVMYADPSAFQVQPADVAFSGAIGLDVFPSATFKAIANPDPNWPQALDVVVHFSAHYCDSGNREVARYHFARVPPPDADQDQVPDTHDRCRNTPAAAVVDAYGCSIAQLCRCNREWATHAAYVRCVASQARRFRAEHLIDADEQEAILDAAMASDCGKHHEPDTDKDEVPDEEDQCPRTDEGDPVDAHGCSIAQWCPCNRPWASHGAYVRCVITRTGEFRDAHIIDVQERETLIFLAVLSNCGRQ